MTEVSMAEGPPVHFYKMDDPAGARQKALAVLGERLAEISTDKLRKKFEVERRERFAKGGTDDDFSIWLYMRHGQNAAEDASIEQALGVLGYPLPEGRT